MKSLLISLLSGFSLACSSSDAGSKLPASDISVPEAHVMEIPAEGRTDEGFIEKTDTLTIAMTGDIMMGTTYPKVALPPNDGKFLFKDVGQILRGAHLAVGNLEGTLCDEVETEKEISKVSYAFRTPTCYAPLLRDAGYDFLSMANNHAFDFGIEGVESTERMLDGLDIKYAGISGRTEFAVVERGGVRFGVCAFGHNGYTLKHNNLEKVRSIIDTLNTMSDIIVVSFHGGAEGKAYRHLPYGKEEYLKEDRGTLREFAHFCVDNGADVVCGHGPHVVRCMEIYKNRFIAYSLGNFCTPYGINITGISGYAPVVTVNVGRDGKFISGKIHSFIQRRGAGPRRDTTNAVVREIKSLTATDIKGSPVKISPQGDISN